MKASDQLNLELPRTDALYQQVLREPDSLEHLVRRTGWTTRETQQALLQLIASGRVTCKPGADAALYTPARTHHLVSRRMEAP